MINTLLPHTKRVGVVGDLHGNSNYVRKVLRYVFGDRDESDADVIVQVGDFGYWGNFAEAVENLLDPYPDKHVIFVDGNHEHHNRLNMQPVDDDGVRRLTEHVWHLPRGLRWQWGDKVCLAAGGAISVDREWRVPNQEWFASERMTPEEWLRCVEGGKVDIVFAHDAPGGYTIPGLPPAGTFPENVIADAEHYRATTMQSIGERTEPELWFHGHYHTEYTEMVFWDSGMPCTVQGLDCDKNPLHRVVKFLDLV